MARIAYIEDLGTKADVLHCIGLDRKNPYMRHGKKFYRPTRNFYALANDDDGAEWEKLVKLGYCGSHTNANLRYGTMYYLTRAGLDWLGDKIGVKIYDENGKG